MKRATYEDVLNAPENKVAEILDGELVLSPRPALRHSAASSQLGAAIGSAFDRRAGDPGGPGGWRILDEPELHLGEHVVVPDLAGWRRERLPVVPDDPFTSLAPDWVCEVLSPSTERIDRGRKLRIYAEAGVAHAWLVQPSAPHARGAAAARRRVDDPRRVGGRGHRAGRAVRRRRARAGPALGRLAGRSGSRRRPGSCRRRSRASHAWRAGGSSFVTSTWGMRSKSPSRVTTRSPCWAAEAAIQRSFGDTGVPCRLR